MRGVSKRKRLVNRHYPCAATSQVIRKLNPTILYAEKWSDFSCYFVRVSTVIGRKNHQLQDVAALKSLRCNQQISVSTKDRKTIMPRIFDQHANARAKIKLRDSLDDVLAILDPVMVQTTKGFNRESEEYISSKQ